MPPRQRMVLRKTHALLLPTILVLVTLGTIVSSVLTPRDISMGEGAMEFASSGDLFAFDVSRWFTAAVLIVSGIGIAVTFSKRGMPRPGFSIWLSYILFVVLNFVLPGLAGEVPGLDPRYLYPVLVITALYFARPMKADHLVTLFKVLLAAFIYGTLVAAILTPDHVLAAEYAGLIPGFDFRLYGIGGGATTLGAQSGAYLALEAVSPSRSKIRIVHVIAAVCTLVLAQSKTAWFFVMLGSLYGLYVRVGRRLVRGPSAKEARMARHAFLLGIVALCVGFLIQLPGRVDIRSLSDGGNIETFTGRRAIWEASVRVWLDNPLFGYGLGMWVDESFRAKWGPFAHSHNQVIHALGSAGLIGLIGLFMYLGAGGAAALRSAKTNAVPLALFALLTIQGLTDVPLRNYFLLDAFCGLHLMWFASVMQAVKSKPHEGAGIRPSRSPGRPGPERAPERVWQDEEATS